MVEIGEIVHDSPSQCRIGFLGRCRIWRDDRRLGSARPRMA
jgi:hypothetical protein